MAIQVKLVEEIEVDDEDIIFQFQVKTDAGEDAYLQIWKESPCTQVNWQIDSLYEIRNIQRKEFGEVVELNAVAESKVEEVNSQEQIAGFQPIQEDSETQGIDLIIDSDTTIKETLEWLQEESKYNKQIKYKNVIPAQDPKTREISVLRQVNDALEKMSVDDLYYHQQRALKTARNGSNLVLATDTASGKSLPYQVHACEKAIKNNSTTLYIAPYKALINDQAETFEKFIDKMNLMSTLGVEAYHGDIPRWKKKRIRRSKPNILLMTPDQVMKSILGWHDKIWSWFLERLDTVIIDEIHEFRGIFGSHISHVCRRLNRVTSDYDSSPQYFCCSATIGNPKEHASNVSDEPIESFGMIRKDTSGRGKRNWLLYNPPYKTTSSTPSPGSDYPGNWGSIRKRILARDNYTCTECGLKLGQTAPGKLHVDHIVPVGRGGSHSRKNLRTLCKSCHGERAGHSISTTSSSSAQTTQEVKQERERQSNRTVARQLFIELVSRGHQTLAFERTRQGTERYADITTSELAQKELEEELAELAQEESEEELAKLVQEKLAERIKPYHAHLPNETREEVESGLQSGEVRGVWSTSALEAGIDVGDLDAVILSGHPGTTMELFQRSGRAGRGVDDCLVVFVASGDPLDQYCIKNPERIFEKSSSDATTNPDNPEIIDEHILCAAEELGLTKEDDGYPFTDYGSTITTLEDQDRLVRPQHDDGWIWQCEVSNPQELINLRGTSDWEFELVIESSRRKIDTTLSLHDAIRDCHPGAIYMLNKQKYKVTQFNAEEEKIFLTKCHGPEFTQALPEENIEINNVLKNREPESLQNVTVGVAEVTYQSQMFEYLYKENDSDENPERRHISKILPTFELDTEALYITIPDAVEQRAKGVTKVDHPFLGGIHGVEHLLRSLFPLEILCERDDIGGFSQTCHPHTRQGTIFVYDNVLGGVGLSRAAFTKVESLLKRAYDLVANCSCKHGCPRCILSPRCQVGNRGLHKDLTRLTLKWIKAQEVN
jgi:DEAD/DEAH box helicase domain-containing protein